MRQPGFVARWRIAQKYVLKDAPWGDPAWAAGKWVSNRKGGGARAQKLRAGMTASQLQRLDALPYGAASL